MVKKNVNFPIETEVYKELKKHAADCESTIGDAIADLLRIKDIYTIPDPYDVAAQIVTTNLNHSESKHELRVEDLRVFLQCLEGENRNSCSPGQEFPILETIKTIIDDRLKNGNWDGQ